MRRLTACSVGLALLTVSAYGLGGGIAGAAEVTDVATAFEKDNPFDFRLRLGYEYTSKTAAIKREHEGIAGQNQIDVFKDLVYSQQRHALALRAEFGLFQDLMFSLDLPIILSDNRSYSYDQRRGSDCVYSGPSANCVDKNNSLTTNSSVSETSTDPDPSHYIVPPGGIDSLNGGGPFAQGSDLVLRGPKRGGSGSDAFDTINFGLTYAILSQRRDDTKPTWIINAEYRLSVGNVMTFDRSRIDANHGVSDGLDHVYVRTAVSHRFRYADPFVEFYYDYPFARRDDTLFWDLGGKAKNQAPQMMAGTVFGLELIPWEKPESGYKIAIEASGRIASKFDGRGYSEAWELLASSPALVCDAQNAAYNPSCSPNSVDPTTMAPWGGTTNYQNKPFSGLTTISNYAILGARFGLNIQASKWVRFRAYFNYQHDQTHIITADDVGKPDVNDSRIQRPSEYNPAYRPVINEVGRRYVVDGVDVFQVGVWGQAMF